jgi:hypothetical protein
MKTNGPAASSNPASSRTKVSIPKIESGLLDPFRNGRKNLTDAHLKKWIESSWIVDPQGNKAASTENKDDMRKFRENLLSLRDDLLHKGKELMRKTIVRNFREDGITSDGQPIEDFGMIESILGSDEMRKLHKQHWKIPFSVTMKNVYSLQYNTEHWLYKPLREWARNRRTCPFDFECSDFDSDSKKRHSIMDIAYYNSKALFKHIHTLEEKAFGMTLRTRKASSGEGKEKKPDSIGERYHPLSINFPTHINKSGVKTTLYVKKDTYRQWLKAENEDDLSKVISGHSFVDYAAYLLASEVVKGNTGEELALMKVKELIQDLRNGTLARPSIPPTPQQKLGVNRHHFHGEGFVPGLPPMAPAQQQMPPSLKNQVAQSQQWPPNSAVPRHGPQNGYNQGYYGSHCHGTFGGSTGNNFSQVPNRHNHLGGLGSRVRRTMPAGERPSHTPNHLGGLDSQARRTMPAAERPSHTPNAGFTPLSFGTPNSVHNLDAMTLEDIFDTNIESTKEGGDGEESGEEECNEESGKKEVDDNGEESGEEDCNEESGEKEVDDESSREEADKDGVNGADSGKKAGEEECNEESGEKEVDDESSREEADKDGVNGADSGKKADSGEKDNEDTGDGGTKVGHDENINVTSEGTRVLESMNEANNDNTKSATAVSTREVKGKDFSSLLQTKPPPTKSGSSKKSKATAKRKKKKILWDVESVLGVKRLANKKWECLLKWKDYDGKPSWEPEGNLSEALGEHSLNAHFLICPNSAH